MRMLGYRRFHLFGCDSCLQDRRGQHHAYSQPENDSELVIATRCQPSGRMFWCFPWMISQGQEFIGLIKFIGSEIDLEIHGDGLLKHIIETWADLPEVEPDLEATEA